MSIENEHGITRSDIDSTYRVLEQLREEHTAPHDNLVNETHALVQEYEKWSRFEDARIQHARAHADMSPFVILNSIIKRLFR